MAICSMTRSSHYYKGCGGYHPNAVNFEDLRFRVLASEGLTKKDRVVEEKSFSFHHFRALEKQAEPDMSIRIVLSL